ncbi:MAG: rhomboid family intramembrane serine protease [candidate division Zixibacteria bacterium RBG_16_50_21]|nr:MAG: rhomboid family intramembrane serine protease [candidate division Zixibacteria bacterium RBG_16_50_21]
MFPLKDDIPTDTRPFVTLAIIAANVLIFFWQLSFGENFDYTLFKFGTIPFEITSGQETTYQTAFPIPLTLFSAMFLHGGWMHIIGNMWYLWIFGNNVEDKLGHVRFFIFYILSGLIATFTYIATDANSQVPMIGASGAIAGVLGAYMIRFPRARVLTLIFFGFFARIVAIPALFVLGFWFVLQLLNGLPALGSNITGGVAWFAHIGGFVAGMGLFKLFRIAK